MSIEPTYPNKPGNGKAFAGVILLAIGGILLLQQISWFFVPGWLISAPMFFLVLGLYIGAKSDFKRPIPLIVIVIASLALIDRIFPSVDVSRAIWPVIFMAFGFWMIWGRKQKWNKSDYFNKNDYKFDNTGFANPFDPKKDPIDPNYDPNAPIADQPFDSTRQTYMGDDIVDTVSVFGGVKRTILSKSFKGGEVVNVFGGTDLDLTQADINGHVILEITQLFGGIKLIIPPHWQVTSDVAAVFSSVDDKRRNLGTPLSPDKILVIKGVSIFAGVDIRSF